MTSPLKILAATAVVALGGMFMVEKHISRADEVRSTPGATGELLNKRSCQNTGSISAHPWQALDVYDEFGCKESPEKAIRLLIDKTDAVMEMSDENLTGLITEHVPIPSCGCPSCRGGAQESSVDVWNIKEPWQIKCSECGMVFPNQDFPLNGEINVTNSLGEVQTYQFYDSGNEKRRYYFLDCWSFQLKDYLEGIAYQLGLLYRMTGDLKYAHKATVILNRYAEVYPHWPVEEMVGNYTNWYRFHSKPPYPFQSGKWGRWNPNNVPVYLGLAYDLIYDSGEIEKLSQELGGDVKRRIEGDLLKATVEFVQQDYERYLGASGMWTAAGFIAIGRTLGIPEYVHEGIGRFRDALNTGFFHDGMYQCGSLGYHLQMLRELGEPIPVARGYSDPPGYVHPVDKLHYEDFDPSQGVPMLGRVRAFPENFVMPDGRYVPVHDSFFSYSPGLNPKYTAPSLKASRSFLFPGTGYALLGRGEGRNQLQAHLNYEYMNGHTHQDMLNILLYAKGKEFLPDLGYSHTKLRPLTISTLGHNTVRLDGRDQFSMFRPTTPPSYHPFGDLLLWETKNPKAQLVEARGERCYQKEVPDLQMYRRFLAVVEASNEDAYVVDIFRVIGGRRQTWMVHGSADEDQIVECSFPLEKVPGTLSGPNTAYKAQQSPDIDAESLSSPLEALVDNLQQGVPEGDYSLRFRFKDGADQPSLKLHMIAVGGETVTTAQEPSIRRSKEDNLKVDDYKMPLVMIDTYSKDEKPLSNVYVAVWEPYTTETFIEKVEPLSLSGEGQPVALAITLKSGRTDFILSTTDESSPPLRTVKGLPSLSIKGRFGMVSEEQGKPASSFLVGEELRYTEGLNLSLTPACWSGEITAVKRKDGGDSIDGFMTPVKWVSQKPLIGRTLFVEHGDGSTCAYEISDIHSTRQGTFIEITADPGWMLDVPTGRARYVFYPGSELAGPHKFIVFNTGSKDL